MQHKTRAYETTLNCLHGSVCDNKEGKISADRKTKGAEHNKVCGIKTPLQSDIDDSSACNIICDESDTDVEAPQNDVVPVSAGAHLTRVSK